MRLSNLFGKTLREDPSDAETASHRLLMRAGLIAPLAAGVYSLLPLGWRAIKKVERIIREEMDRAGGQELRMPVLQPSELWEESGRKAAFGDNLFSLEDRRGRPMALGPTHEEVITLLVRQNVASYRDLPQRLYQIQTKFRDEPRPRGGLLRVREFDMKDLYSFDCDAEGLEESYQAMLRAYANVFDRCGLPFLRVEADSGAIGGKDSHEFILEAESGEDHIIKCRSCGYAANQERAVSAKPESPEEKELAVERIPTPGCKTIQDISRFLGLSRNKTLKAVFYIADGEVLAVTVRGDLDVNEVKLKNLLGSKVLRLATDTEAREVGLVPGYASAVGLDSIRSIADESVIVGKNFVAGANEAGFHLSNVNHPRDLKVDLIADITNAEAGHACLDCGEKLEMSRGIEVGHVFKLGTVFSEQLGASFLDLDGKKRPVIMGCYGIGVGRLMAAAIEQNHDEKGIIWPPPIAPYGVHIVSLGDKPEVIEEADGLYQGLWNAGVEVLYDDRAESAGVKFNDADLIGLPLRITVSQRGLKDGQVELKQRANSKVEMVPIAGALEVVQSLLGQVL